MGRCRRRHRHGRRLVRSRKHPVRSHCLDRSAAADPPPAQNAIHNLTAWESLNSWITPNDKFFSIAHYNRPTIDAAAWRLNLSGLVKPTALTLDQLKAVPRQEVTFTLECSGNNGLPFAQSMIGNAQWTGA